MMNVKEKVLSILTELSGSDEISENSSLMTDIHLDSLGMVTLLVELEDTFGITLDESDMNPFDLITAADVILLVEKYGGDTDE